MSNKIPKRADCDLLKDTLKGASLKNKGFISCMKDALHVIKSIFYRFICPAMSFIFLLLGRRFIRKHIIIFNRERF